MIMPQLQWGRALTSADNEMRQMWRDEKSALQWGRALTSADNYQKEPQD